MVLFSSFFDEYYFTITNQYLRTYILHSEATKYNESATSLSNTCNHCFIDLSWTITTTTTTTTTTVTLLRKQDESSIEIEHDTHLGTIKYYTYYVRSTYIYACLHDNIPQ